VAKKSKKKIRKPKNKTTDWNLGQPLAFPPKLNRSEFERLVREVLEEAMSSRFKAKRQKRRKK
jgi:hypothetical protein